MDERYERFRPAWTQLAEQARSARGLGGGYDERLARLIAASEGTVLRRFYPFTAMAMFCFACSPYPFERVQPTCIEIYPYGPYRVMDGGPYPASRRPGIALDTTDAHVAIDAVIGRLVGC